jgi:hypothetical protein
MNPADPMAELFEICETALSAARERPLTEDEICALKFAAGVPGAHSQDRRQEHFNW